MTDVEQNMKFHFQVIAFEKLYASPIIPMIKFDYKIKLTLASSHCIIIFISMQFYLIQAATNFSQEVAPWGNLTL